jgi:uncharacterized protein YndB with AHSA1/START domain
MPTLETAPAASNILLTLTRIIRAPRARVYQAWTNPEIVKQWFGPGNMYCPHASVDARVGGAYSMEAAPTPEGLAANPNSTGGTATGTFTRVVPNELLQFTWKPSWNPGEESLVTVSLRDVDGGTELTLRHENFASEQSREGHNKGWSGCLDKLTAATEKL